MRWYIVRHAQSERNAYRESGPDAILTDIGKEQARRLGRYFHKVKIDKIYCSPMKRAKATLQEIRLFLKNKDIIYTKEMVEHCMGIYEQNGKDDWAELVTAAKNAGLPLHLFRPEKGESMQDTYERAGKFYKSLLRKNKNKDLLLVGHGLFFLYLILNALNLPLEEGKYYQLSNASVSTLNFDLKGRVKNFHINDYNHLIEGGMKRPIFLKS